MSPKKQPQITDNFEDREFVPTGHFYSAVPSKNTRQAAIESWEARIKSPHLDGIDIDEKSEEAHFNRMLSVCDENTFPQLKSDKYRYFFENPAYSYSDALSLHALLRYAKPRKLIEVGSGYSSAMTLDTVEFFLNRSTQCTFIEPYPELLNSLITEEDKQNCKIVESAVQSVDPREFLALEKNDILFIDSTHVSKLSSDVNYLFFDVLPKLQTGVYVHIHDIFWPFDYPPEWLEEGRAWNEAYMLRALLSHSTRYEIVFLSNYHYVCNQSRWNNHEVLGKNPGAHIWIRIKE